MHRRLCLSPVCRIGEVGVSRNTSPTLANTKLTSSRDSCSSGWSKRIAALQLRSASLYDPGSKGVLGFWEVSLWECDPPDLGRLGPIEGWGEVSCPGCVKLPVPLCPPSAFLSFLLAAPESLVLAVGSCWTLMSSSAGLPIEAPCSVRPDGLASGVIKCSVSLGLLEDQLLGWFARTGPLLSVFVQVSLCNRVPVFRRFLLFNLSSLHFGSHEYWGSNGHHPQSPIRVEGINTTGCCLVPRGDRLGHCLYHPSAMQPSARCLTPWLG